MSRRRLAELRAFLLGLPGASRFVRAVALLASGFRGEAITLRASALTYLTLLSLVPLLAVVYSALDLVSGQEHVRAAVQGYVNEQLGIGAGAAVAERLDELTTKASIQALGVIGLAALAISVVSLLWNVESAFNHIYAVKRPRKVLQRLLKYWTFLTLGPLMLGASLTASWKISQMQVGHLHHAVKGHSEILHALAALSSVAITYAGLAFLYKVLPNARVRLHTALLAAFATGTVWELAKFAFAWASARMVQVHRIYGSLAVLPIVLTWIYISWVIALVGCRLCYALDASRKMGPHPALQGVLARETFAARVMIALAALHRSLGRPVSWRRLRNELEATPRMVREALVALERGGLVVEARRGGYLPSRDPGLIQLAHVRAAARASVRYPSREADELGAALREAWERADAAAGDALAESIASVLSRAAAGLRTEPPVQAPPRAIEAEAALPIDLTRRVK